MQVRIQIRRSYPMLRTTMLALAAAVTISGLALGSPPASAAPVVAVRVFEGGSVQPVWYRPYYHRYSWYRHHRRWW
jgi:hypothetical protein